MEEPASHGDGAQFDRVAYYKHILTRGQAGSAGGVEGLDSQGAGPDLSESGIKDRTTKSKEELYRIVQQHLGGQSHLYEIADRLLASGEDALRMLRDEDPARLGGDGRLMAGLEAIVRTDGSRPSFLVKNGSLDSTTSPIGQWEDTLIASRDLLEDAIACVGRIDVPGSTQGFEGTGFLIHENLIVTNRHVLQAIATPDSAGAWTFFEGVTIDFGHEFRARESITPRALKRVVFCPSKPIKSPIDHTKLDLVLIELEPADLDHRPRAVLAVDIAPDWAAPKQTVFVVGYPANPGPFGDTPTLLEQLFQNTFGFKRVAPGEIIKPLANVHTWTLGHDVTTLGGNSGSAVVVAGRENLAAGLHYGGRRGEPRENWGHVLGRVLEEKDKLTGVTLSEQLNAFQVKLKDRA